jgi:hypothetical protein
MIHFMFRVNIDDRAIINQYLQKKTFHFGLFIFITTYHLMRGNGFPVTTHLKLTGSPSITVTSVMLSVNTGAISFSIHHKNKQK